VGFMHKFWVLVSQTYKSKIKSKAFAWTTLFTILIMFAGVTLPDLLNKLNEKEDIASIAVVGTTSEVKDSLEANLEGISVEAVNKKEEAEDLLHSEKVSGYLEMNDDRNILKTKNPVNPENVQMVAQALQISQVQTVSSNLNVSGTELQSALTSVPLETEVINNAKKSLSEKEQNAAENMAIGILFLLYTFVTLYGMMIAMEIAKEKGSRIMEVIISSSSATAHFFGKLVGVFLISLTQLGLFGLLGFLIIKYFGSDEVQNLIIETVQSVSLSVWIYALVFSVLGYLFYGILAAFIGSLVSKVEDINNYMSPISYVLMIALLGALVGISSPSSILITIGSYIPFFTPMLMFIRISLLETSNVEIILSLLLLGGSVIALMALCVRFYQGSVLLYSSQSLFKSIKSAWKLAAEK
jgi:ABC-2 type transport system permease protein